ncbi:divalent-cation tolerance protein CutA [Alteromonas sp. H39]|uniref:divalent-cation tolerance protein CutA n=1 Tax=Alteromonas sp. H39 TaxID=3389876 RepID=UPI0039E0BE95
MSVKIALCTVPDKKTGSEIAARLVKDQLAACVNVAGPVMSFYQWDGALQQGEEFQLIIKTTHDKVDDAYTCVEDLHPYDVMEWLVIDEISGSNAYVNWLTTSVN